MNIESLETGELLHVKIKDFTPASKKIYMIINKNKKNSIAIENWIKFLSEINMY